MSEERDKSDVEKLTEEQKKMWRALNPEFEYDELIESFRALSKSLSNDKE